MEEALEDVDDVGDKSDGERGAGLRCSMSLYGENKLLTVFMVVWSLPMLCMVNVEY